MQVQKGLVKYKDRSDILCTYGITEDGKTYYFLDGQAIPNGNIVATTVLVEAIDPLAMASSIGLIDANGNVIIPFENKAIKLIANDLLLVEKAKPVTESVIEAIELRSDPQSASRLVTTPAVIKENMNAKMGAEGRFVFNDQFSEATICDINGNNLVDGELYSFVGVAQDKLYLSKNTPDSFVSEFSLGEKKLVLTPTATDPMMNIGSGDASEYTVDLSVVQQNAEQAAIDAEVATAAAMSETEAAMSAEEAIRTGIGEEVSTEVVAEEGTGAPVTEESTEVVVDNAVETGDSVENENPNAGFMPDDITAENFEAIALTQGQEVSTEVVSEETTEPVVEESTEVVVEEASTEPEVEETVTEEVVEEESTEAVVEETTEVVVEESTEAVVEESDVVVVSSDEVAEAVEVGENTETDLFAEDFSTDIFAGSTLKADTIDTTVVEDEEDDYQSGIGLGYLPGHASKDNLIEEVTKTVNDLLKVNRSQKQKIIMLEESAAQYRQTIDALNDKTRRQSRDYEKLKASVENYRTIVGKFEAKTGVLEARNEALESRVSDQERTIYRITEENKSLREQAVNNEALVQILAEARSALVADDSYDSDDIGYYKKAA